MSRVRLAVPADAARIAAIYEPYVTRHATSFELVPPGEEEMRRRIEATLPRFPWLAWEDDAGETGGYAYAGPFAERAAYRWSASVSVYLDERYHRRGAGRALYTALFATLERQGIVTLFAGITVPNAASFALHESMGFKPCALLPRAGWKFGAWHDVAYLVHHLGGEGEPPEPIPFAALGNAIPGLP